MLDESTQIIILKRQPIFETDCLFTAISRDKGKVFFKAKGVLKPKSKYQSLLVPPNRLLIRLTNGTLPVCVEVREMSSFAGVPALHASAVYVHLAMEIILKVSVEGDQSPELFDHLNFFLDDVSKSLDCEESMDKFLLGVLAYIGVDFEGREDNSVESKLKTLEYYLERKIISKQYLYG